VELPPIIGAPSEAERRAFEAALLRACRRRYPELSWSIERCEPGEKPRAHGPGTGRRRGDRWRRAAAAQLADRKLRDSAGALVADLAHGDKRVRRPGLTTARPQRPQRSLRHANLRYHRTTSETRI
jgi:hypothetical protein